LEFTGERLRAAGPLGICIKGAGFSAANRSGPNRTRLRSPEIKRWGRWRSVTWATAYQVIARNLLALRRKYGRQAIAYYGVGQLTLEAMWLAKKLFQGYLGSNNVGSNAELCLAASAGGHELVFGNEGSFGCYEDYLAAETICLYGSNQRINHPTLFNRYLLANHAAVKVVIDPRVTETVHAILAEAPQRNLHLQIRSRGDVRLNLAIARALRDAGALASDYLERHVDASSLAAFHECIADEQHTPAAAARALAVRSSAIDTVERQIHRLAELWATSAMVTTSSVGVNQTSGSEGVASILNLHLLTANLGQPGRGHVRLAGQSNASGELAMGFNCKLLPFRLQVESRRDRVRMGHLWGTPPWSIHPERGVNVTDYPRAAHLRFFFIQGTDFVRNMPDLKAWHQKLRDSFVVACDPFELPGARKLANVLLPARTHSEIDGTYLNGERRLQPLRRIAEPEPGCNARSDTTILVELAAAIAARLVPLDQQLTDVNERYLENRQRSWLSTLLPWDNRRRYPHGAPDLLEIARLVRRDNRDLDPRPLLRNVALAYPRDHDGEVASHTVWDEIVAASRGMYNEFSDGSGRMIDSMLLASEGEAQWHGPRRYLADEHGTPNDPGAIFPRRFRSEVGRARLIVPRAELLHPVDTGAGRFNLITGRGTAHDTDQDLAAQRYGVAVFNSAIKIGVELAPDHQRLFISPEDAEALGLVAGSTVEIRSRVGTIQRILAISPTLPPGHLFSSFYPDRSGSTPNAIVPSDAYDPYVFQPTLKIVEVSLHTVTKTR
jgi:anaerobic selenocysteine-containing dehydrogenase